MSNASPRPVCASSQAGASRRPSHSIAKEVVGQPRVGDLVRGAFGTGTVRYVAPPPAATAGWLEVDGDGGFDTFAPSSLTVVQTQHG